MNKNSFTVVRADKNLFSVYQTIYSNADTNMQFNWQGRLTDTLWTDECYWIMKENEKIGGILIVQDTTRFAFLIPPFNDRELFWKIIHDYINKNNQKVTKMYSVHDCDVDILLSYGYKIDFSRKMMCRPTDSFTKKLDEKFYCNIPVLEKDLHEMTTVCDEGYKNGVDYSAFGIPSRDDISADITKYVELFKKTNTLNQSIVVFEKGTNKIAGFCIAGKNPEGENWKSQISDIVVLPKYRNYGIGEFMIYNALTESYKTSQIIELCVTVGNTAERLYRKIGFMSGPRFSSMSLRNT